MPSVNPPLDDWILAATTPVSQGPFAGVYSGGTVTINGVADGTAVLVQVRAWSVAHADYSAAWRDGSPLDTKAGASNVMQVTLGGGTLPVPSIGPLVEGFTIINLLIRKLSALIKRFSFISKK